MGLGVVGILDGSWGHLSPVPFESRWVDSTARTMHFKFLTGNSDVKHICLSIIGLLKAFMCDLVLTTLVSSLAYSEKPFIGRHIMSYYCSSTRLVRPSHSSSMGPCVSLMVQTLSADYIGSLSCFPQFFAQYPP